MKILKLLKRKFTKPKPISKLKFWILIMSFLIISIGSSVLMINLLLDAPPKIIAIEHRNTGFQNYIQDSLQPKSASVEQNPMVTIEVFSDLGCPFSSGHYFEVKHLREKNENIEFVYKHFPKTELFPHSNLAAQAVECADDQGMFWQSITYIYKTQETVDPDFLYDLPEFLSIDDVKYSECLDSGKYLEKVNQQYEEGKSRGVTNVPTTFIGDQKRVGFMSEDSLAQLINSNNGIDLLTN